MKADHWLQDGKSCSILCRIPAFLAVSMRLDSVQLRVQEMDLNVAGAFLALFNRDASEIRNFVEKLQYP